MAHLTAKASQLQGHISNWSNHLKSLHVNTAEGTMSHESHDAADSQTSQAIKAESQIPKEEYDPSFINLKVKQHV